MEQDVFDVAIVGAGVAGALLACKLAEQRLRVALLDAGPVIRDRRDRVGDYAAAREKSPGSPYAKIAAPSPETDRKYYRMVPGSSAFKSTYERVVGGSTWHWLGNCPRLLPSDFQMCSLYGVGTDWPISYDELERWYTEAEDELGVSGNHEQWDGLFGAYRSKAFPMEEIWPSYSDVQIERALGASFEVDGVPLTVMRTPQARNSRQYRDRPPCAGNSSCVPICPIGAKYDASVHVRRAEELGAKLLPDTVVTKILADGEEVRGVAWAARERDQRGELRAQIVVVAAHAIESVRLLEFSEGVHKADALGRNLMDHLNRFGWVQSGVPLYPFRGPPTTSGIDAFRDGLFRRTRAAFRLSLGNDGAGRAKEPQTIVVDLAKEGFIGAKFAAELRTRTAGLLRISCSTEMLPSASNTVRLRAGDTDRWGVPMPELHFKPDEYTRTGYLYAEQVMKAVFGALDASAVQNFLQDPDDYSGAGHIMGTTRMGSASSGAVLDRDCLAHGHKNLYVVGSSVFPTCGTANPTLTVAALSLRLADTLLQRTKAPSVSTGVVDGQG